MKRIVALALIGALSTTSLNAQASSSDQHDDQKYLLSNQNHEEFVGREGDELVLDDETFRFSGPNIYWLGLDENVDGTKEPTYFRIDDALKTASDMGANVVRSHTLGISTGHPNALKPSKDEFNQEAFDKIDYAIAQADKYDIRLIIPFTDNWQYYHGGKNDFASWYDKSEEEFYTDTSVRKEYKEYIDKLLNHENKYTGEKLKDDPTIMAWQLGNELNNMPQEWINSITEYVSDSAPKQLVSAGQQSGINEFTLIAPELDIVDVHYYPPTVEQIEQDAKTVTSYNKVYTAGEYSSKSSDVSQELFDSMKNDSNVTGASYWSLFAHADDHGYVPHDDGFTLHYPGDNPEMREVAQMIRDFSYEMQDEQIPDEALPGQPAITSLDEQDGNIEIAWRGSTTADKYSIQSANRADGPWETISDMEATDNDTPFTIENENESQSWYRVVPYNLEGKAGEPSAPLKLTN